MVPSRLNLLRYFRGQSIKDFAHSMLGIVLIITVILCFYGVVFGDYGLLQIFHLRNEQKKLCREIEILKMKQKVLENYKLRLENDEFLIEKLARERAGLCKPGEILFVFQEEDASGNLDPFGNLKISQGLDNYRKYP